MEVCPSVKWWWLYCRFLPMTFNSALQIMKHLSTAILRNDLGVCMIWQEESDILGIILHLNRKNCFNFLLFFTAQWCGLLSAALFFQPVDRHVNIFTSCNFHGLGQFTRISHMRIKKKKKLLVVYWIKVYFSLCLLKNMKDCCLSLLENIAFEVLELLDDKNILARKKVWKHCYPDEDGPYSSV